VIDRFNEMPAGEAVRKLYSCFAWVPWADRVASGRPYRDFESLLVACDAAWSELGPAGWQAAFAAHPRIGESGGHSPDSSEREQAGIRSAAPATMAALAEENRRYESHFGHVFLISASGRTADEILAELRRRMRNDPATEAAVAAGEHRKITRIRLERLLSH
jgi:OHCU decarboxylase